MDPVPLSITLTPVPLSDVRSWAVTLTPPVPLVTTSIAPPCADTPPAAETVTAPPLESLLTRMPAFAVPPNEVTEPFTSMLTPPPPVFRATIPVPPVDLIAPAVADCVMTMPPAPDWIRVTALSVPAASTVPSFSLKSSFVPEATDGVRAPSSPVHSKTPLPEGVSSHLPRKTSCLSSTSKLFRRIENRLVLSPASTALGLPVELVVL